jgi:glutathione S-transferase
MRLYLNETSPFSRFVVIVALEVGGGTLDFVWLDPWSLPDSLLQHNPFSIVPTLEIEGGLPLCESVFICDYLLAQGNGAVSDSRRDVKDLHRYAFGKVLMETAFKKVVNERFLGQGHPLSERGSAALIRALCSLETSLAKNIATLSLADLCLAVALEYIQFRLPDLFTAHTGPLTLAWLTPYRNRASFIKSTPERLKAQPASSLDL